MGDQMGDIVLTPNEPKQGASSPEADMDTEREGADRPGWDNKAQFILATIGFAVGLGNVWRFPWLCQKNGGGAFLIPYFIMLIIEGIPIFFLELSIGQRMRQGSIRVWNTISPYTGGIGIASTIVCIFVSSYYNVVVAWVLFYFVKSFQSPLPWEKCPKLEAINYTIPKECSASSPSVYFFHRDTLKHADSITSTPEMNWNITLALVVGWFLVWICILKGIKSSGKVVYFTATFPYVVLFAFLIRGLTLKGYDVGLKHLFTANFERLQDPLVWLDAATQIFFSLGLAFGTMIAYASYNPKRGNTLRDAVTVSVVNSGTSLFASIVVFSILGFRASFMMDACEKSRSLGLSNLNTTLAALKTTGMSDQQKQVLVANTTKKAMDALPKCNLEKYMTELAGGPGLVFIAFTDAINEMPGSNFWSVIFFLMLLTLGLDSLFGALESITTSLQDLRGFKSMRKELLSFLLCVVALCIGLSMTTTVGEYILQMFDSFSGNLPLLLIAIAECVTMSYIYGIERFFDDIEHMTGQRPGLFWKACWMFISPISMAIILIATIVLTAQGGEAVYYAWKEKLATYQPIPYPPWAVLIIVLMILTSSLCIPIVALIHLIGQKFHKRTVDLSTPDSMASYINKAM